MRVKLPAKSAKPILVTTGPASISMSSILSLPTSIVRHRFTIEQYHEMIEGGIFAEDEPIELIHGEIVQKMPIGNPHAAAVNRLTRVLSKRLEEKWMVSVQNPLLIEDSEPEPDVAILTFCDDLYASRRPVAADAQLLIEVSDPSLAYDREIKGPVYAQAGIGEYWIVNLTNDTIEIYRDPQADGRYATVNTLRSGDTLKPIAIAGLAITVDEILASTIT